MAENADYKRLFRREEPFDAIFFSYSMSMICDWREAFEQALIHLKPEGSLFILDFWDFQGFITPLRQIMKYWLKMFHVRFEPRLLEYITAQKGGRFKEVQIQSLCLQYAFIAHLVGFETTYSPFL